MYTVARPIININVVTARDDAWATRWVRRLHSRLTAGLPTVFHH